MQSVEIIGTLAMDRPLYVAVIPTALSYSTVLSCTVCMDICTVLSIFKMQKDSIFKMQKDQ